MDYKTDDLRIKEIDELVAPVDLLREFAMTRSAAATVWQTRQEVHKILHGADDRLLVIMGPCSIHDVKAAKDFAQRLHEAKSRLAADLLVVMRVYFEKPRTTVGWKGLINDPNLDGSFRINDGLRIARRLLLDLNEMEMPVGCEFLDMITPQYIGDLVSWGAIGARTTESQVHRELASGLSCPVGFKNGTDGNVQHRHRRHSRGTGAASFSGGHQSRPLGDRGDHRQRGLPHHFARRQDNRTTTLQMSRPRQGLWPKPAIPARIMIDFSHGNSGKDAAAPASRWTRRGGANCVRQWRYFRRYGRKPLKSRPPGSACR